MEFEHSRNAQMKSAGGIDQALAEIHRGQKTSHWIWYVFPRIAGLARSRMARRFALGGLEDAQAYLRDAQLRPNYLAMTRAVRDKLAGSRLRGDRACGSARFRQAASELAA